MVSNRLKLSTTEGGTKSIYFLWHRYGWHFPELGKILTDNVAYVKTIKLVGMRENMADTDLSDILMEEVEQKVKEAAEISMGK